MNMDPCRLRTDSKSVRLNVWNMEIHLPLVGRIEGNKHHFNDFDNNHQVFTCDGVSLKLLIHVANTVRVYFNGASIVQHTLNVLFRSNAMEILYGTCICVRIFRCICTAYRHSCSIPLHSARIAYKCKRFSFDGYISKIHALCLTAQPSFDFSRNWFIGGFKCHANALTNEGESTFPIYSLPQIIVARFLPKGSEFNNLQQSICFFSRILKKKKSFYWIERKFKVKNNLQQQIGVLYQNHASH